MIYLACVAAVAVGWTLVFRMRRRRGHVVGALAAVLYPLVLAAFLAIAAKPLLVDGIGRPIFQLACLVYVLGAAVLARGSTSAPP